MNESYVWIKAAFVVGMAAIAAISGSLGLALFFPRVAAYLMSLGFVLSGLTVLLGMLATFKGFDDDD